MLVVPVEAPRLDPAEVPIEETFLLTPPLGQEIEERSPDFHPTVPSRSIQVEVAV
jgi:hypothetical protein